MIFRPAPLGQKRRQETPQETPPSEAEDGAFTHSLLLRMEDKRGLHGRNAALLFICLRRASRGTRVGFQLRGRLYDLGQTSEVRANRIVKLLIKSGEEVLCVTAGPDAEPLLLAVAQVFAFQPSNHMDDWRQIAALLGGQEGGPIAAVLRGQKQAQQLQTEIRQGYYEILCEGG